MTQIRPDTLYVFKESEKAVQRGQHVNTQDDETSKDKKFLHCAACRNPITQQSERIMVHERHKHVFANPHGYLYHIGCFAHAQGCLAVGEDTSFFSWFPSYTWRIALCGHCLEMLGWAFHSQELYFWGLILDKLRE